MENNKDWKEIHDDFTEELQQEWENKGFSYEECREWIKAGAKIDDYGFISHLRKERQLLHPWTLSYIDAGSKELRWYYQEYLQDNQENNSSYEEKKQKENNLMLSSEVIEQIKIFPCEEYGEPKLTLQQEELVEKLIPNEELRYRYKWFGLCEECDQPNINYNQCRLCNLCKECNRPNTGSNWCHSCNSKHFQEDFKNWTSGNLLQC